jgi:hypothetical protein
MSIFFGFYESTPKFKRFWKVKIKASWGIRALNKQCIVRWYVWLKYEISFLSCRNWRWKYIQMLCVKTHFESKRIMSFRPWFDKKELMCRKSQEIHRWILQESAKVIWKKNILKQQKKYWIYVTIACELDIKGCCISPMAVS